jgi:TATA-box binding protein (TBP) (component of TFIID and TFIIIB)
MPVPKFDSFAVSTKTFIVYTNLNINIEKIFKDDVIPITEYKIVKKKRGRKKKQVEDDPNKDIPCGSIICIEYKNQYRGVKKTKTVKNKDSDFFRNSMPITMKIHDKFISIKVSEKGKFQMTGCKSKEHAEACILSFWDKIKHNPFVYRLIETPYLTAYYECVMHNIDFSVGFTIDRETLDIFINSNTKYTSFLETTSGYTGINIKFPTSESKIGKSKIDYHEYKADGIKKSQITHEELSEKVIIKKKKRYNTFLVFQSGSIIMSGKTPSTMEDAYYEFFEILKRCFPQNF